MLDNNNNEFENSTPDNSTINQPENDLENKSEINPSSGINNAGPNQYQYNTPNNPQLSGHPEINSASSGVYNYSTFQYNQPPQYKWQKPQKQKKQHPVLKKVGVAICLGLVFGVAAGAAFSIPAYISNQKMLQDKLEYQKEINALAPTIPATTDNLDNAIINTSGNYSSNVATIANKCLPSVVSITNKGVTQVRTMFGTYKQDTESSGSGIIIGENETELLIVTNYHVVSGSKELSVVFSYDEASENPSVVSAKIKGYVANKDLAVIAVSRNDITDEMRAQLRIASLGDSSKLELGQQVVAIGNALGYGQSVTTGIISALNREVAVSDDSGNEISNKLIQTDAAINPGNSGGALLNMDGELIGINSVKVANSQVEGMGYAIPISDVQSIIEDLMLKETRDIVDASKQGYLGIAGTNVAEDISKTYDMPMGIYVNTVYENSPAQKAGMVKGIIITKFDGTSVSTMNELQSMLQYYKIGETVEVIAMVQSGTDGYVERTYTVTLGSKNIFGKEAESDTSSPKQENEQQQPDNNNDYYDDFFGGSNPFGNFFWPW